MFGGIQHSVGILLRYDFFEIIFSCRKLQGAAGGKGQILSIVLSPCKAAVSFFRIYLKFYAV